ncbi:MAG: Uma2 family endonuclease [Lachnospiraceae bacterium]|nr:Uma2 family endonuclease [Lachnospiraceae bacterium]
MTARGHLHGQAKKNVCHSRSEEIIKEARLEDVIYTEEDYYALPEERRAELIEGVFYDMAVPSEAHQRILMDLATDINNYIRGKKGDCRIYPAPFAVRLFKDDKTIVEPDISVICDKDKITEKGCNGAPDWVIEILSPSNQWHDTSKKLRLYMTARVREYWIVDPEEETVTVYSLADNDYRVSIHTFEDSIRAGIYEDLTIKIK